MRHNRGLRATLGAVLPAGVPDRRSIRLRDYDYAAAGPYFVTLCADRGRCVFGRWVNGRIVLAKAGHIVASCWQEIPSHFANVTVDAYVVMPNHFHGIVVIHEAGTACRAPTLEGDVPFAPILHEGRTHEDFGGPVAGSLATIVRSFKSAVSREVHKQPGFRNRRVWQRGYYEQIIRNARSLEEIRRYIAENPSRWPEDPEHPLFIHER